MNINPLRKRKIIELYNKGVDMGSLSLVTGYSQKVISTIIRTDEAAPKCGSSLCLEWAELQRSVGLL